jgi:anti-sigma factor RsiW
MMNVHLTSSGGEPDFSDIDERDAQFIAFLEGDLSEQEREEFEVELERDVALRREFDQFADIMNGMQSLPFEFAPPDFVENVQRRIRKRSRGRFFAENFLYNTRMPYEAIAVVMIAVMAAAWMLMGVPKDRNLQTADVEIPPKLETRDSSPG